MIGSEHRFSALFLYVCVAMSQTCQQDHTLLDQKLHALVITLENHDGIAWNSLMSDLEAIYKAATSEHDFLVKGSARCSDLAAKFFWAAFPQVGRSPQETNFLTNNRTGLIAGASTAIAISAMQEFQLGNFQ
jgi:hypothetical protein